MQIYITKEFFLHKQIKIIINKTKNELIFFNNNMFNNSYDISKSTLQKFPSTIKKKRRN